MEILRQNKVKLENDVNGITTRKNPNSNSWIYLTTVKIAQRKMVADNKR